MTGPFKDFCTSRDIERWIPLTLIFYGPIGEDF
jgi:hypothetical protein